MSKILDIQAKTVYKLLKANIKKCIENDDWERYKSQSIQILKQIKLLKEYIESLPTLGDYSEKMAADIEYFESAYYKMIYYKDLWASSDWILYTLQNTVKGTARDFSFKTVNAFIEALLSFQLIKTYKGQISKIINANVSGKQLLMMYDHVRLLTDNFKNKLDDSIYITEKLNEGFFNPFEDVKIEKEQKKEDNKEDRIIKKIKPFNSKNQQSGINYKNDGIYANTTFYRNDIIEESPIHILNDADLYSPNVRKLTFIIDSSKRIFGIPLGLATFARTNKESKKEGNIDYEFDPDKGNKIVIYATRKIKKGDELIFVEDNMCESDNVYDISSIPIDAILDIYPITTNLSKNDPIHTGVPYKSLNF